MKHCIICNSEVYFDNLYCTAHSCKAFFCKSAVANFNFKYNYCFNHKCMKEECDKRRIGRLFCLKHILKKDSSF